MSARRPCVECPWRVDVEPGQFPPERYEALRATTGEPGNEAPYGAPMFACHKAPEGQEFVCAGWQAAVGIENLTARVAASQGIIDPEGFRPGDDWPELHATYDALLAVHGDPRRAGPLRREPAPAKETAATESRLATEQEEA